MSLCILPSYFFFQSNNLRKKKGKKSRRIRAVWIECYIRTVHTHSDCDGFKALPVGYIGVIQATDVAARAGQGQTRSQTPPPCPPWRSSPRAALEGPTHHADPIVQVGGRDQGCERGQRRFFHPAQQPRDGRVDHQCQWEEEPVEKLRPGAAHLADDHLALLEQKAPGEKHRISPGIGAKGHPCSLQVAFMRGKQS